MVPPMSCINRLNRNALVSLDNDVITKEKIEINISINPNTVFLTNSNKTADVINQMVLEILFSNQPLLGGVLDGNKQPIKLYKNMTVVVTQKIGKKFSCFINVFPNQCFP